MKKGQIRTGIVEKVKFPNKAVVKLDPLETEVQNAAAAVFCVFMVGARVLSGVHWISDIIGGVLLSGALVSAFAAAMTGREKV